MTRTVLNSSQSSRARKEFKGPIRLQGKEISIISLDKGDSSDRGYDCEPRLSRQPFKTIYDSRVYGMYHLSKGQ